MQCLIDFLSYENQMSIINLVQNRDETYQQELNSYKQLFLTMLNNIMMGELAKSVEDRNQNLECIDYCPKGGECAYSSICYCIYKTIMTKIERNDIKKFFDTITYCYQCRINTDASTAIKVLELLLDEYDIIPPSHFHKEGDNEIERKSRINFQELKIHNLDKRVLFRGRISVKEDQYFGKMDIFHVPYTQRYNLKNERFSLTGQPALYLGNSIPDLLEEMDINIDDRGMMKRVRISSYECISPKGDIYDLRCNYYDALNRQEHKLFTKELFFRNLMALICSFRKRKELTDSTFKEEYVIPQLFTQILKSKNYKGICYYSTKPFETYSYFTTDTNIPRTGKNMLYKENFVFFTDQNINSQESFDLDLYDSFEISMPSSVGNETIIARDNLDELVETIRLATKDTINDGFQRFKEKNDNSITIESWTKYNENRVKKAQSIIQFYNEVFVPLYINGKKYNDTDIGIMHKRFLTGILNRLLVDVEIDNNGGKSSHAPAINDEHENDTKVELCDIFGKSQDNEFVRVAHRDGLIHKAQIVFIIAESSDGMYKIASKEQNFETLIYSHSTDLKNVILDMNLPMYIYDDKKQIGQFLNKECYIEGQEINELLLIKNFEVVEVYVSYFKDELPSYPSQDNNTFIEWIDFSMKILESKLKSYNGNMGNLWIQALAILANYLYKDNLKGLEHRE